MIKKVILVLAIFICWSCQSNMSQESKDITNDPNYNKGFVDAVLFLEQDIENGVYGQSNVLGAMTGGPMASDKGEAYREGFKAGYNKLTDALIRGYISHEKYLVKQGWRKGKKKQ